MRLVQSAWAILASGLLASAAAADPLADGEAARTAKNYDAAMRILLPLANGGSDEAQRIIGEMIFNAQGSPYNAAAALAWTRLAAENGNKIGQYNLGYMYESGAGVAKSIDQAIVWYRKSAGQNYALAQRRLGDLYAASDPHISAYWYNQALLNGDRTALDRYGGAARQAQAIDNARAEELRAESAAKAERERAEYAETRRMQEEARPSGNVIAQGIAEGLTNFQRDSAGIAAIHAQTMANIQAQQAARLRAEREQAAREHAQDQRNRQIATDQRRPPIAEESADQARRERDQAVRQAAANAARSNAASSSDSLAANRATAAASSTVASVTQQAASSPNTPTAAAGIKLYPVQSWTWSHLFLSVSGTNSDPKDEVEARRQVSVARAHREKEFAERVSSYRKGGFGLDSWRVTLSEPVQCLNKVSYNRPYVECSQRVDYAVVITGSPVSGVERYAYYSGW